MIKKFSTFIIIFGVLTLQIAIGWSDQSRLGEEPLQLNTNELLKPLMEKTNDFNETAQNYWALFDKNVENINRQMYGELNKRVPKKENDTCLQLMATVSNAQNTVNNATVLLVEVLQKMAGVVNRPPSCVTINIFAALSCTAHKAQDIRNIYFDYKSELITNEGAAANKLEEIVKEFIYCIRRL